MKYQPRLCGAEGGTMLKIDENIGALVADETKGALRAIDNAILSELRLCTTLVEAFERTAIPVGASQKLLQNMTKGINHIVAGRGEMAGTVRALAALKSGSTLGPVSYNCPNEPPFAKSSDQAEPDAASPDLAFG
jgi:hypothetical protein